MDLNVEDKTKFEKTVIFGTFEKGFENQNGETFKESKAQEIKLDRELTIYHKVVPCKKWLAERPSIEETTRF